MKNTLNTTTDPYRKEQSFTDVLLYGNLSEETKDQFSKELILRVDKKNIELSPIEHRDIHGDSPKEFK